MAVVILSKDNKSYSKGTSRLYITFDNIHVSVVNGLRRVITSNIPSLVFRGFPYKDNKINIFKNTTKFNNEYLKHRISCIPIINSDESTFSNFQNLYKIQINKTNNTLEKMFVTTKDIIFLEKDTSKEIKEDMTSYFPPDPYTGDYILICILYPNQNSQEENESIHLECEFDIGTSEQSACWNQVHHCIYENVMNESEVSKEADKIKDPSKKKDFLLLDAQKINIPKRFTFSLETIGIYNNNQLILKGCKYILQRITQINNYFTQQNNSIQTKNKYNELINDGTLSQEERNQYSQSYCALYKEDSFYILEIKEDDYTIGKLIEHYFYEKYSSITSFVGFKKEHPTKKEAYIYIKYSNTHDDIEIYQHFVQILQVLTNIFTTIQQEFVS